MSLDIHGGDPLFELLVARIPDKNWKLRPRLVSGAYGDELSLNSRELVEGLAWGGVDPQDWIWDGECWQHLRQAPWAQVLRDPHLWLSPWLVNLLGSEKRKIWVLADPQGQMMGPFSIRESLQSIRRQSLDIRQLKIWCRPLGRWELFWHLFPKPAWEFLLSQTEISCGEDRDFLKGSET